MFKATDNIFSIITHIQFSKMQHSYNEWLYTTWWGTIEVQVFAIEILDKNQCLEFKCLNLMNHYVQEVYYH